VQEVYPDGLLAEQFEELDFYGFFQNAEVLIGLIQKPENISDLRYAVPTCWGPLHVNLDELSSDEREELLKDVLSQVANQQ